MPARRSAVKALMSFEQLDALMERRLSKSDRYWDKTYSIPLRGKNYSLVYSRPASHFTIRWTSTRSCGRSWPSAEIAAGPDGSTIYVLPRITLGSSLRGTHNFFYRWQRDRFRWTPYQYGDKTNSFMQAAYVVDKNGSTTQVELERAKALCVPAEPPFARMSHAEWLRHIPKKWAKRKRMLAAGELLYSGVTKALSEFGMPFVVQRSLTSLYEPQVLVIAPPTTSSRARTISLQLALDDHELRKQCGVSVDYAQRHVIVKGRELCGSAEPYGIRQSAWPSPTHAVRGVVDWFLTVGVHIPGPSLC